MLVSRLKKCLLLCCVGLLALSANAQTTSPISKQEKVQTEAWHKAHKRVKLVPASVFARASRTEQSYMRATSTVLVLQGETLRQSDIERYNREVASLPAYATLQAYQQARAQQKTTARQRPATNSSTPHLGATNNSSSAEARAKDLERLRRSDPAAYKAHYAQNPAPVQRTDISRAKYNQMPAAKRAQIDAQPQRYRIVD